MSTKPVMTIEQFRATRTECSDLGADLSDECLTGTSGYLYCGVLYIERFGPHCPEDVRRRGAFHLLLGRDEWVTDDVAKLETILFAFAQREGYTA
jgi:hypothetical protein